MTKDELQGLVAALPAAVTDVLAPESRAVVTGCAGFIGSHLCEALLALGCHVTGVDCLTDYYDPEQKREHLAAFRDHDHFTFRQENLLDIDARELLAEQDVCFHLAAQAGVRASWGDYFQQYLDWNVLATQRLLEATRETAVADRLRRFVYSSSSSVYGDQDDLPVTEAALPKPRSPYGVTKMAGEHMCVLYADNFAVPTVSLRYFTVYGPRQRPDMAFRKFIEAALDRRGFRVYGDGGQTRDFTYVVDAVRANLLAAASGSPGAVFNVGGGERIALNAALDQLTAILREVAPESRPEIVYEQMALGDVRDTYADRSSVERSLGYRPSVSFAEGLAAEVHWAVARRRTRD